MQRHVLSGGRYPVLRALAIIYVVGAALTAAATAITLVYIVFAARFAWTDRLIMCVGALGAGFFLALSALAIAEVLKLAIDIEHNTRMGGARTMVAVGPTATEVATMSGGDGLGGRLSTLDEETAEAALFRGH